MLRVPNSMETTLATVRQPWQTVRMMRNSRLLRVAQRGGGRCWVGSVGERFHLGSKLGDAEA
jgi:hypothetical protein